jgi:hypothetical protein
MVEIEPQCPEIVILSEKAWRTRRTRMRLGRKEQGETHEDGMEIVLRLVAAEEEIVSKVFGLSEQEPEEQQ